MNTFMGSLVNGSVWIIYLGISGQRKKDYPSYLLSLQCQSSIIRPDDNSSSTLVLLLKHPLCKWGAAQVASGQCPYQGV